MFLWNIAVTSLAEVWIEITALAGAFRRHFAGHFPCGSVDRNNQIYTIFFIAIGHFPCGSVDRNRKNSAY